MSWAAVAGAAVGVVGGALSADSGGGGGGGSSTQNTIDPRMDKWIYGTDGGSNKGLLSDNYDLYNANKSGLNDQMRQGLNTQWGVYNNPATMGGYQQMSNLGSGLMGAPVMGNPFSDGRVSLMTQGGMGGMGSGGPALGGSAPRPQFPSYQPVMQPPQQGGGTPGPFAAPPPGPPAAPPAPPSAGGLTPITNQDVWYSDPFGNSYRKSPNGEYINVVTGDYGTGNGGA